jgi:hypothetical protein
MDPNETLKAIRKNINVWEDGGLPFGSREELEDFIDEVCESVLALDEWLIHGGFKPNDWN